MCVDHRSENIGSQRSDVEGSGIGNTSSSMGKECNVLGRNFVADGEPSHGNHPPTGANLVECPLDQTVSKSRKPSKLMIGFLTLMS